MLGTVCNLGIMNQTSLQSLSFPVSLLATDFGWGGGVDLQVLLCLLTKDSGSGKKPELRPII